MRLDDFSKQVRTGMLPKDYEISFHAFELQKRIDSIAKSFAWPRASTAFASCFVSRTFGELHSGFVGKSFAGHLSLPLLAICSKN